MIPSVNREVVEEGIRLGYPDAAVVQGAVTAGYIEIHMPSSKLIRQAEKLAGAEKLCRSDTETLLLAKTLALPLLTDEKVLSMLGRIHGLEIWNTWTVLLEGLRIGLLTKADIQAAIDELSGKRHKLSSKDAKDILDAADRIEWNP
jgi:predicted nucleic acid-binding protein